MKLKLPFEITKFFDIKVNPETGKKELSLKRDYAYPVEENFKAIKKNFNNLGLVWTDWTPSYDGAGGMTFTNISTYVSRYFQIGKMVLFVISFDGTTGGIASPYIRFTLPVEPYSGIPLACYGGGCSIWDGSTYSLAGSWNFDTISPSKIAVFRYDEANFGLGLNRGATVQGFYEIE